jgi:phosphate transport system substrate-binding protein
MMKNFFKLFMITSLVLFQSTVSYGAGKKITTAGSSTIRPIVEKAAKEFKKSHPDVVFVVGGGGSSHGVKSTANGDVLIGQASRHLKEKEKEKWSDLVAHKIGLDGIAVIVNKKNPISKISKKQVQDIYTGKIKNWKKIGGIDAPIILISKEEGRSTLELFLKYFNLEGKETGKGKAAIMVHRKKGDKRYSKVKAKLIGPNREAIAAISTKKNAIAYVSVGTAQEVAARGGRVKLLVLDGVPATIENVANESYPLRRPLHLVTKGEANGIAKKFIDYITSKEGQEIVSGLEFIPINLEFIPIN